MPRHKHQKAHHFGSDPYRATSPQKNCRRNTWTLPCVGWGGEENLGLCWRGEECMSNRRSDVYVWRCVHMSGEECICLEMCVYVWRCLCLVRGVYVRRGVHMSEKVFICLELCALWLGATFHYYEICCSFPQNSQTLDALDSSIFIRILCRLLPLSNLHL